MLSKEKTKSIMEKALKYKDTPAPFGEDINLEEYVIKEGGKSINSFSELDEEYIKKLETVGIDSNEENTQGTYLQVDNKAVYSKISSKIEMMPISEALEKYDLDEYIWNIVDIKDKYTARVALELTEGFFIRVPKGVKETIPLQTCLLIGEESSSQNVHNIIIVEEDAELNVITGCTTSPHVKSGLHIGVSEFYVGKNGKLTYTMIHDWGKNVHVRPRTAIKLEENAQYISNYVIVSEVKSVQSYPTAFCDGDNSSATFQTISYGKGDSVMDMGSRVVLNGKGSKCEMVSRNIVVDNAKNIARGHLIGNAEDIKGHLECRGLILSDNALLHAIPELEATKANLDLSHEAAVGKIAEDQLMYLMSRGLTEDEATSLIIKGFLSVDITGLPPKLAKTVSKIMEMTLDAL